MTRSDTPEKNGCKLIELDCSVDPDVVAAVVEVLPTARYEVYPTLIIAGWLLSVVILGEDMSTSVPCERSNFTIALIDLSLEVKVKVLFVVSVLISLDASVVDPSVCLLSMVQSIPC